MDKKNVLQNTFIFYSNQSLHSFQYISAISIEAH